MLNFGSTLGEYVLQRQIGRGGMAEIWAAQPTQTHPDPIVALKVLRTDRNSPTYRDLFVDEARLGTLLRHPNLVRVYGFDERDGFTFLVMEYLEGRTLQDILLAVSQANTPLPLPIATFIFSELAIALDYAHHAKTPDGQALNVVHRDISPHNILITLDGIPKLLDFGIARAEGRLSLTMPGVGGAVPFKGKFGYCAPEQARGLPLSPGSDVYTLGIVLWELLTLRRCFGVQGKPDSEALAFMMSARARPITSVRVDLPGRLARLVDEMLSFDPTARPTAKQVAARLRQILYADLAADLVTESEVALWLDAHCPTQADESTLPRLSPASRRVSEFAEPTEPEPVDDLHDGPTVTED